MLIVAATATKMNSAVGEKLLTSAQVRSNSRVSHVSTVRPLRTDRATLSILSFSSSSTVCCPKLELLSASTRRRCRIGPVDARCVLELRHSFFPKARSSS
jgi:hypothetical protein